MIATKEEFLSRVEGSPELRSKVGAATWDAFVESIIYKNGGLATMQYDEVKNAISENEFTLLLEMLGSSREKFARAAGYFCYYGGPGGHYCAVGNGYCDPSYCHNN